MWELFKRTTSLNLDSLILTVDYSRFFEREDSDLAQSEILVDIPNFSPPMLDLEVVPERSLGNEQWEFALGECGISSKSEVTLHVAQKCNCY